MLALAFMLLMKSSFLMLRLGSGSFPRTLSAAEERHYVELWLRDADLDARNELIEHNLRLVAHIINNG